MEKTNFVEFKNISKSFGNVKALNDVSFEIHNGEILSLLGENGSGKTTLMNVLSGIYFPDKGKIFINGKHVRITSPNDAFRNRVGMVHQHFKLVDVFTGVENVVLGLKKEDYIFFQDEAMTSVVDKFKKILKDVDPKNEGITLKKQDFSKFNKVTALAEKYNVNLKLDSLKDHFTLENYQTFMKQYDNFLRLRKSTKGFNLNESNVRIERLCKKYGFSIDCTKKVYEMSVSEKQTLEIIKILYRGADVLILDEPTAVLTPQETKRLFDILKNMREMGKTVIIITHKLNEVMEISDRVGVLRKGEFVGMIETKNATEKILTEMMVGKKVELNIERNLPKDQKLRLEIKNLTVYDKFGLKSLDNVSFSAYSGEILGIAGITGCGQKELLEAIAGLQRIEKGSSITYHQRHNEKVKELVGMTAKNIHELGIHLSFVPEDRLGMGLIGAMGMTENILLKTYNGKKHESNNPFISKKSSVELAKKIKNELEVATPSIETPVRLLSGGNVQKVLVGREISNAPAVLLTAYAVRGLDINSSYTIYNLLNKQKENGVAVIYVGEDLDVLLALCDRIVVLCNGKVNGILDARKTDKLEVGRLMTNLKEDA